MAKTKTVKRGARPPLSSLADELGIERDELVEIVQRAASAQLYLAKRHAKLVRYKDAAEECMRAFAAIGGNEFELGRTLGVRPWGPDPRPELKLRRKISDWARDNPAIEAHSPIEFMRAFAAADEGNKEALRESLGSLLGAVPWVLSKIEACKGYARADEDPKTIERRLLIVVSENRTPPGDGHEPGHEVPQRFDDRRRRQPGASWIMARAAARPARAAEQLVTSEQAIPGHPCLMRIVLRVASPDAPGAP